MVKKLWLRHSFVTIFGIAAMIVLLLAGSAEARPKYIEVSTSPPNLSPPPDLSPEPNFRGGYYNGTTVTVTAHDVPNYIFQRWVEDGIMVNTSASYTFNVTENRTLIAEYAPIPTQYIISVSTSPLGLTQPTGGGTYDNGTTATITAQQVTGYTFQGWNENGKTVNTSTSYTFIVYGNRSLVAEYSRNQYNISISTSPSGLAQPAGRGIYYYNDTATITAQQVAGYTFQRWSENETLVSTDASFTFTVTGDRNLMAEYLQSPYKISISTSPSGLNPQPTGGGIYSYNDTAKVAAQPVKGYTFQRWTENGNQVSTDTSYSFNVTGNRTLTAEYSQNQYNISVSTLPSGLNPQPTGGGMYHYNDTAKITTQSVTGYTFQKWTENGNPVSTGASYSFNVTGNRTLIAEYLKNTYTVSVSTSPVGLDSQPAGGGNYYFEDAVTVTAQPVTGYTFQRWTENGNPVSTDLRYSFKANGNRNLVAEYSKAAVPSITIEPSPGVKGTEITAEETKNSSAPAVFEANVKPPILRLIIAMLAIIAVAGILKYLVVGTPKLKVDIEKLLQMNIETNGGESLDKPELRQYKVNVDVKGGIEKL